MNVRTVIVDDHPAVATGLALVLAEVAPIDIVAAVSDARDALAVIARTHPDVVVCDMAMRHLGGPELVESVRRLPLSPNVMMLSALHDPAQIVAAFRAGAQNYVFKDSDTSTIAAAIVDVGAGRPQLCPEVSAALAASLGQSGDQHVVLSQREAAILALVARGMTNRRVARQLNLSEATVKTYLARCYAKLGVNDRASAVHAAMQRGLLPR